MTYFIKQKDGFFRRMVNNQRSNYTDSYQVFIKGTILIYNSRSSWRGLNTVRRVVKDIIRSNVFSDYDYHTRVRLTPQLEKEIDQIMKTYVGYDKSYPIYIKKIK